MKALVRDGEAIPETNWNAWIQSHIEWMTTPRPDGDGYTLVEDYQEGSDEEL